MEKIKLHLGKVLSSLIGLIILVFTIWYAIYAVVAPKTGYEGVTDNSTMESYRGVLLDDKVGSNGSRNAGRVWADKSVFNTNINLSTKNDGIQQSVRSNTDFLHVFSTLGSSQTIIARNPIDLEIILDITNSMLPYENQDNISGPLHGTIVATNRLIEQVKNYSSKSRIGITVYWGTGKEMIPLTDKTPKITRYERIYDGNSMAEASFYYTLDGGDEINFNPVTEGLGGGTDTQSGIVTGMKALANNKDSKNVTIDNGDVIQRVPVVVLMTDGASNHALANAEDSDVYNKEFKDIDFTRTPHQVNLSGNWWDTVDVSAKCSEEVATTKALISAAYYKEAIKKNYGISDMPVYAVGLNVLDDSRGDAARAVIDPKQYFQTIYGNTYNNYLAWKSGTKNQLEISCDDSYGYAGNKEKGPYSLSRATTTYKFNQLPAGDKYKIKTSDLDINYATKSYLTITNDVGTVFEDIYNDLEQVLPSFTPIGGQNDNGVQDSITYMDPIGDYMEIKEGCITTNTTVGQNQTNDMAMLLFGQMHGMVRAGVYNYEFNKTHGITSEDKEGWYDNEGQKVTDPSKQNWENATYRLSASTTKKYVSTLDENGGTTSSQQRNTTYTIYRFTDDKDRRNEPQKNPSYNVEGEDTSKNNVTYLLSDIRVWSEYTGDYIDEDPSAAPNKGYDEALYVNIPVKALPVQMATINLDKDNKDVTSYKTNLNKETSTPFRLFYGVGIQDNVKTENGLKIDMTKISPEYKSSHKDKDGYIQFYSNFYSGSEHIHEGEPPLTIGDANFTFSPNSTNRYYVFQKPLQLYEAGEHRDTKEVLEINNPGYNEFKEKLKPVTEESQLSSDNYYYIEVDYYVPTDEAGNGKLVHALVLRKGSEFGSDIPGAEFGEYLAWYNTKDGSYTPYGKDTPKPSEDYVITTKPKGLRMGQICSQYIEKKDKSGSHKENPTGTAENSYLPTVSGNSTTENTILNGYLGNNGVLKVKDSSLEITKEIEGYLGDENYKKEEFNFELKMPSYKDESIDAVSIYKNDSYTEDNKAKKWLIQPGTIDIVTTNEGFIQSQSADSNQESQTTLATTDDGKYYIYVGNSIVDGAQEKVYHLYDESKDTDLHQDAEALPGVGKNVSETDGSIEYWTTVYKVPVEGFTLDDFQAPTLDNNQGYEKVDKFVICKLDATKDIESQLTSDKYLTRTSYKTTTLTFDEQGVTESPIKLKDGEGILLLGLENGTDFTVKEKLTAEQEKAGYRFDHVYNNTDDIESVTREDDGSISVTGEVNRQANARGRHFVNRYIMLNDLSISKEVRGAQAVADGDDVNKEWNFNIKLTFKDEKFIEEHEGDKKGSKLNVNYNYYKKDEKTPFKWGVTTFDWISEGVYEGTVTLKHNEKITLQDILSGTDYIVTEQEAQDDTNGYVTTFKNATGTIGGSEDNVQPDILVEVVNNNPARRDLTLKKTVKGQTADYDKEWEFTVTLTPPADYKLAQSYEYTTNTGRSGTLNLGKPAPEIGETRSGTIILKHGEIATIKNLPEGTTYTITETKANQEGYETVIPDNATNKEVNADTTEVEFVNSLIKTYSLDLKKTVTGFKSDNQEEFNFRITFTPNADFGLRPMSYTLGEKTGKLYVSGTLADTVPGANDIELQTTDGGTTYYADFKLKDGDIIHLSGIVEGTKYAITEAEANQNGYETKIPDNATGTLDIQNPVANVEFINARYRYSDLMISKKVEGETGLSENREFEFTVKFKPAPDVTSFATDYQYEKRSGGNLVAWGVAHLEKNEADGTYSGTFKLKHDEHFTIKNLPERTQYWVNEDSANEDGYKTNVTKGKINGAYIDDKPEVEITGPLEVEFTNRKIAYYPLTVTKIVQGENVDANREFKFRVTFIPAEDVIGANEFDNTILKNPNVRIVNNGNGTYSADFTLKGGEVFGITDIPERTQYVVEELDANQDGYIEIESNNAEGTITGNGEDVTFTNTKLEPGTLTVSKETEGGATGNTSREWHFTIKLTLPIDSEPINSLPYTARSIIQGSEAYTPATGEIPFIASQDDPRIYVGNITLKHGQAITLDNIPIGTNYEVKEAEANDNGFVTYTQGEQTGTVGENVAIVVAYKNKKPAARDLIIEKTVAGSKGDKDAIWNFDIKLTPAPNVNLERYYSYIGTGGKQNGLVEFVKQQDGTYLGHITLKHNQTVTIKGLPSGTSYVVTEREANQNDYTTQVNGQTIGELTNDGRKMEFVNTKIGAYDLSVTKKVTGRLGDRNRDWRFKIVFNIPNVTDETVNFAYVKTHDDGTETSGTLTFTKNILGNYEAETTLKHGDKVTIQDIAEGTQYTVSEIEANQGDYLTTYTKNCQGTIVDGGTTVEFVNRFRSAIDLILQKVVAGLDGEYDRMWTYEITIAPPTGVTLNSSYHFSGSREGEITFTPNQNGTYTGRISIKHGETLAIEGLPEDSVYNVVEVEANKDGYTTTDSGNTQGSLNIETEDVVFTNTRKAKLDLAVEKKVEGSEGDRTRNWTFEVTLTPPQGETLDNFCMYTGSKIGIMELTQNEEGTYTGVITLRHGERVVIQDLPEGTQYKVVEKEANQEGYTTTDTGNTEGELDSKVAPNVTFTNKKVGVRELEPPDEETPQNPTSPYRPNIITTVWNPRTSDNIKLFVTMFFVAVVLIAVSVDEITKNRK